MSDDNKPRRKTGAEDNEAAREALTGIGRALQVGALTGTAGLLAGAFGGILRSTAAPTLFAVASGIQWFTLGSTYTATRQLVIASRGPESPTPVSPIIASSIAGATAGGVGGALRSRRNILPGMLFFGLAGAVGQKVVDMRDSKEDVEGEKGSGFGWMNGKWSPVKVLTDQEYEVMLREKILRVDADIAIVDESISAVKEQAEADGKAPAVVESSGESGKQ